MIILDKPYVSHLLSDTIKKLNIPVIKLNDVFIPNENGMDIKREEDLLFLLENSKVPTLFNSENGLHILGEYLPVHYLTTVTNILKNKVTFRKVLNSHFKDFYFQEVSYVDLEQLEVNSIPFPIIIKPTIGYSSIGVHRIDHASEYEMTIQKLKKEMEVAGAEYPNEVINQQSFLLEELINGEEYAVDAYFTEEGTPVILNVFKRMFLHEKDMSDRIYYTSKFVIQESLDKTSEFLEKMGSLFGLRETPIHIEFRINDEGRIIPIETNPLRFAGIGTNELGVHAYGINAYEYYFKQLQPDWHHIIQTMDDSIYSFCCAEIDSDIDCKSIETVQHEAFQSCFNEIMEYRKMPEEYSTFAVVFYKSPNLDENKRILTLDLNQFIKIKEVELV